MKHKEIYPSKLMNEMCEQAGCDDHLASKHAWKWERKHWHSHPIPTFCAWWEPHDIDPVSGASVGGHPDARRIWARKDAGKWSKHWYGVKTEDAWNTARFVEEFDAWVDAGRPEPETDFVSISATLEKQKEFWKNVKPIIAQIGKINP